MKQFEKRGTARKHVSRSITLVGHPIKAVSHHISNGDFADNGSLSDKFLINNLFTGIYN